MNKQASDRENIFTNHISDLRLVCKMYKGLSKLNDRKIKNLTRKLSRHFPKEGALMVTM